MSRPLTLYGYLLTTSSSTSGVIVKIEGALLRILDQNGGVRVMSPSQVTPRRENKNFAVATDSQGNDMRVGDQMKEVEGEVSATVAAELSLMNSNAKEKSSTSSARSLSSFTTGTCLKTMECSWPEPKV